MIHAVLLDLDNTMVLFDEAEYLERYFERLTPRFSDLFSEEELRRRMFAATAALRRNDGARSNRDRFLSDFVADTTVDRTHAWGRFMRFYEYDYAEIRVAAAPAPGLAEVLDRFGRSGCKLVLASNPVFPRIAQQTRMGWAGIPVNLFDLFTHIGNMSYVKPNPEYYQQICDMLREPPAACLMVGNDPVGDMTAKLAGLRTYRATDAEAAGIATVTLTEPTAPKPASIPAPDFSGPLSGVLKVVENAFSAEFPQGFYRSQSVLNGS